MLSGISFIGIDSDTNLNELKKLPTLTKHKIEFGILYSENKMDNSQRYPNKKEILKMLDGLNSQETNFTLSLHLCGQSVSKFLSMNEEIIALCKKFNRVQLNIPAGEFKNSSNLFKKLNNILSLIDASRLPFIVVLQYNSRNKELLDNFINENFHYRNCFDILFDNSGGLGKEIDTPFPQINNIYCGYAGGINPDNINTIVEKINTVAKQSYYIDMESGIREDDLFSIQKCQMLLENLSKHKKMELKDNIMNKFYKYIKKGLS